jgi:general stress protein 26
MNAIPSECHNLFKIINQIKYSMFTTIRPNGHLSSRPMEMVTTKSQDEGILWFFSKRNSLKNDDINNDQQVNLTFTESEKHRFVSISGKAFISDDKNKMEKLWEPDLATWFPEGLNDKDLTLIGVELEACEVWESSSGKFEQIINFVMPRTLEKSKPQAPGHDMDIRQ